MVTMDAAHESLDPSRALQERLRQRRLQRQREAAYWRRQQELEEIRRVRRGLVNIGSGRREVRE